jgi:hypothetical protein
VAFRNEDSRSAPGRRQLLTGAAAGLAIGAGVVAAGAVVAPGAAEAASGGSMVTISPSGDTTGKTDAAAINGALSGYQGV